jgi:hypothetical protein
MKHVLIVVFEANRNDFPVAGKPGGSIWWDISVIPHDCGPHWDKCIGKGIGFNVPMKVQVVGDRAGGNCPDAECWQPQCAQGYKFPSDDKNTHVCPAATSALVVTFFC